VDKFYREKLFLGEKICKIILTIDQICESSPRKHSVAELESTMVFVKEIVDQKPMHASENLVVSNVLQ